MAPVSAHPNPKSFCHAVTAAFTTGLREAGHAVEVVDIYAIKFDPGFRNRDLANHLHENIPPDILETMDLRRQVLENVPGGPLGRFGAARWMRDKTPQQIARFIRESAHELTRKGWERHCSGRVPLMGLRYPGVKNVEHVYFYRAAVADEPRLHECLRRARQLGRGFALPAQAPPAAAA